MRVVIDLTLRQFHQKIQKYDYDIATHDTKGRKKHRWAFCYAHRLALCANNNELSLVLSRIAEPWKTISQPIMYADGIKVRSDESGTPENRKKNNPQHYNQQELKYILFHIVKALTKSGDSCGSATARLVLKNEIGLWTQAAKQAGLTLKTPHELMGAVETFVNLAQLDIKFDMAYVESIINSAVLNIGDDERRKMMDALMSTNKIAMKSFLYKQSRQVLSLLAPTLRPTV